MAIKAFAQWIDHTPDPFDDSKIAPYLRVTVDGSDMGDLETRDFYMNVYGVTPSAIGATMDADCVSAVVVALGEHGISVGLLDSIIFR